MSYQPIFQNDNVGSMATEPHVDRLLGNAYEVVRYVAQKMQHVQRLSTNMQSLVATSNSLTEVAEVAAIHSELVAIHAKLPELISLFPKLTELLALQANTVSLLALTAAVTAQAEIATDKAANALASQQIVEGITAMFGSVADAIDAATAQADIATDRAAYAAQQVVLAAQQASLATTNGVDQVYLATVQANLATTNGAAQVVLATTEKSAALAAKVLAEAARDAALIQAGVYTTEALGRAAVANNAAFKVQGTGDIAAYEYRKSADGLSSELIASYPSIAALSFLDRSGENFVYNGKVLSAILDSESRALAVWLEDGVLRGKLGIVTKTLTPLTTNFDVNTGLTSIDLTAQEVLENEVFIRNNKIIGALVDSNFAVFLAMQENGKTYIPKLTVDSVEYTAGVPFTDYDNVWSESSNYVFTQAMVGDTSQIFRTPKVGGKKVQITFTGNNYSPIVSGDRVTYTTDRTTPSTIYGQPLTGGTEVPIESTNLLVALGNSISVPGSYTSNLAALRPTQTLTAQGVSGQITTDMAYRINALPVTLSVTGGSIPASALVGVTGVNTTLFRRTSGSAAVRAIISGVAGILYWTGGQAYFQRDAAGSAVSVVGTQTATITSGFIDGSTNPAAQPELSAILAGTVILWPAYNDPRLPVAPATTQANIAAMVSTLTPLVKRLIIIGDALGQGILTTARFPANPAPAATDAASKVWADAYLSLNTWMQTTYPDAYFDLQGALITAGYSSTVNLVGVDYSIINGTVFPDGIHPGGSGLSIIANIVNSVITSKGW